MADDSNAKPTIEMATWAHDTNPSTHPDDPEPQHGIGLDCAGHSPGYSLLIEAFNAVEANR